jgi:hypothetical protein
MCAQRLRTAFLHEENQINAPEAGGSSHQPEAGEDGFANET